MSEEIVDILLVEDNPSDIELTLHTFRRINFASAIHVAHDGAEALEFIFCTGRYAQRSLRNVPRLILLDLKLPLMDGLEVLQQVKSDPRTRFIPIVVLSSSREERDISACYQAGVNSYITKPVDFEQFREIARILGRYWLLMNRSPSA
jgi:two-component system response regulator